MTPYGEGFGARDESLLAMRRALESEPLQLELNEGAAGEAKWLQLPAAAGADYRWSLWFYANGERHIYATRWPLAPGSLEDDAVVWYHPFELEDYHRSIVALDAAFREEVFRLLRSYTRIRRRRLLVNWSIELESSEDGSSWERRHAFRALRAGWNTAWGEPASHCLSSSPLAGKPNAQRG